MFGDVQFLVMVDMDGLPCPPGLLLEDLEMKAVSKHENTVKKKKTVKWRNIFSNVY